MFSLYLYVVIIMQSSLRNFDRNPTLRLTLPLASITAPVLGEETCTVQGQQLAVELKTKVPEDCAKFYNHGQGPY